MAPRKSTATGKDANAKAKGTKSSQAPKGDAARADKASTEVKLKAANAINVRHILCEKHSVKEQALSKLQQGTKFDEVAREFSEDKARQGGSLGWRTRGSLLAEFEAVAYTLEASTTANPVWGQVKTKEGYHILMVEGRR